MKILVPVMFITLVGCGSVSDPTPATNPDLVPGFNPTPPAQGQIQVITPILPNIMPGTDVTYCSYLDYKAEKDWDVTSYLGFQSAGGHHTILYAVPNNMQEPNTHECTDADMFNVKYIGGGGTDATIAASSIPEGIAFRIPKGAGIMMISHWINATSHAIDGQAAYNISVQDHVPSIEIGDLFTTIATNFNLPLGPSEVSTQCTLKQDLKLFVLGGHAHEWTTQIAISQTPADGSPSSVLYDTKWSKDRIFNTPLNSYTKADPLVLHAGDTFNVKCTYNNTTKDVIQFPTEMCVGFGYFFPATSEIDCVDGIWPSSP